MIKWVNRLRQSQGLYDTGSRSMHGDGVLGDFKRLELWVIEARYRVQVHKQNLSIITHKDTAPLS